MTPDDLKTIVEALKTNHGISLPFIVFISFLVSGIGAYLGSYLGEKAKNRATKEDIVEITRKIESARAEYTRQLEDLKGTYQIHAVSAIRRMDALQGAFIRWTELIHSVHTDRCMEEVREGSKWFTQNCIFLPQAVRNAFHEAIMAATLHKSMLEARHPKEEVDANWTKIRRVSEVILHEANLPPLRADILEKIEKETRT